jgi:hypothetical protein
MQGVDMWKVCGSVISTKEMYKQVKHKLNDNVKYYEVFTFTLIAFLHHRLRNDFTVDGDKLANKLACLSPTINSHM